MATTLHHVQSGQTNLLMSDHQNMALASEKALHYFNCKTLVSSLQWLSVLFRHPCSQSVRCLTTCIHIVESASLQEDKVICYTSECEIRVFDSNHPSTFFLINAIKRAQIDVYLQGNVEGDIHVDIDDGLIYHSKYDNPSMLSAPIDMTNPLDLKPTRMNSVNLYDANTSIQAHDLENLIDRMILVNNQFVTFSYEQNKLIMQPLACLSKTSIRKLREIVEKIYARRETLSFKKVEIRRAVKRFKLAKTSVKNLSGELKRRMYLLTSESRNSAIKWVKTMINQIVNVITNEFAKRKLNTPQFQATLDEISKSSVIFGVGIMKLNVRNLLTEERLRISRELDAKLERLRNDHERVLAEKQSEVQRLTEETFSFDENINVLSATLRESLKYK